MTVLNGHGQSINRNLSKKRLTDRTIDELIGLSKGIVLDGVVSLEEANYLAEWLKINQEFADVWPVNVLAARMEIILADGIIDDEERKDLFGFLTDITGIVGNHEIIDYATGEIIEKVAVSSTALPLDTPPPAISFCGKSFCFTGKFFYGGRKTCEEVVINLGGSTSRSPVQNSDYLIIGMQGSSDWIHSTHGRKIEKAVEMKDKGHHIAIISEEHWCNYL